MRAHCGACHDSRLDWLCSTSALHCNTATRISSRKCACDSQVCNRGRDSVCILCSCARSVVSAHRLFRWLRHLRRQPQHRPRPHGLCYDTQYCFARSCTFTCSHMLTSSHALQCARLPRLPDQLGRLAAFYLIDVDVTHAHALTPRYRISACSSLSC